jgi:DNA polymerase III sliding clamp (beta) subunit (PCNA family)
MIIELKTLKEIVSLCKLFVVKKPSHEIFKYVHINIEEELVSFTVTDSNSWLTISTPIMKTTYLFKVCVELSVLEKGLKAFTGDHVYFEDDWVNSELKLINGTKTLTIAYAKDSEYPLKPQDDSPETARLLVEREEFLKFFKSSVTAIKVPMTSYQNPVVNSLFLEFKDKQLVLTGTDGHSAIVNTWNFENNIGKSNKVNVTKASMVSLYNLIQKARKMSPITLRVSKSLMKLDFWYKDYQISTMCNLYEEAGVDIEKYFSLEENYTVTFDAKELKSCLTFMKSEQAAKFEFTVIEGHLRCIAEAKNYSQSISTTNNENNFMFWVSPEKLLNNVSSFPETEVTLTLRDNKSPIIIHSESTSSQKLKSLVMPLNPDKH